MIENADKIEKKLMDLQKRKDEAIKLSSDIIRLSGRVITKIHGEDLGEVKKLLATLNTEVKKLKKIEAGFEYNTLQAHQEYVEAHGLYIMCNEHRLPSIGELDADEVSYLLGLLDSVGELKRGAVDQLRKGNFEHAQKHYDLMLEIYDSTIPMRFANSLVPDFRKKQDVARIQIERLSSELLLFQRTIK